MTSRNPIGLDGSINPQKRSHIRESVSHAELLRLRKKRGLKPYAEPVRSYVRGPNEGKEPEALEPKTQFGRIPNFADRVPEMRELRRKGLTNKEVAREIGCSHQTVERMLSDARKVRFCAEPGCNVEVPGRFTYCGPCGRKRSNQKRSDYWAKLRAEKAELKRALKESARMNGEQREAA